mmetsp:Transcript_10406/g.11855  ORF Transcript_10406/g.11855 Transcript_10406/m.11855 type:complete len:476 (+) Transcript_10406:80-1507(+)
MASVPSAAVESGARIAREFVEFVNKSVTPFHAVANVSEMLKAAGYVHISEHVAWTGLAKGGRYFVTRNGSSVVAFAIGGRHEPCKGYKVVGGHTDSPNFQLKPNCNIKKGPYHGVAVQCYGGGLWHTWFDRELTVAGRVVLRKDEASARLTSALVHIPKPLMRIPSLAIHLRSQAERDAFSPNKETHLVPLIASELYAQPVLASSQSEAGVKAGQSPLLMKLVADAVGCDVKEIVDFDLSVVDTQPATVGGALDEFVFAPRIDNLASCFCGIKALVEADETLQDDDMVRIVGLFDHEEVGSESAQGAGGTLITDIVDRFHAEAPQTRAAAVSNSFLFSVDCAHAAHPNYMDKHEDNHRPHLHLGPAIKYNANTRYATNGMTAAVVRALGAESGVPLQPFCVKNDSPCGTTIGPILSTLSGIAAVDIGAPMWSMHSVRETCGTVDLFYLTKLLRAFFDKYQALRPLDDVEGLAPSA